MNNEYKKLTAFIAKNLKTSRPKHYQAIKNYYKSKDIIINKYDHLEHDVRVQAYQLAITELNAVYTQMQVDKYVKKQDQIREDLDRLILIIESLKRQKSKDVSKDFKSFLQTPIGISSAVIAGLLLIVIFLLIVLIIS